jgi:hypothetical protein
MSHAGSAPAIPSDHGRHVRPPPAILDARRLGSAASERSTLALPHPDTPRACVGDDGAGSGGRMHAARLGGRACRIAWACRSIYCPACLQDRWPWRCPCDGACLLCVQTNMQTNRCVFCVLRDRHASLCNAWARALNESIMNGKGGRPNGGSGDKPSAKAHVTGECTRQWDRWLHDSHHHITSAMEGGCRADRASRMCPPAHPYPCGSLRSQTKLAEARSAQTKSPKLAACPWPPTTPPRVQTCTRASRHGRVHTRPAPLITHQHRR